MQASRHDENHVKNLLLWLRERAKASRKSRNDESFSDAADLIEELVYGEKRLQRQLAAAKRDGERPKWRPIAQLHEDFFPVLVTDPGDMSDTQFLMSVDDWNELEPDVQADYTLFHALNFTEMQGYCPVLDVAVDAARQKEGK